ncbi:hypothetical protein [Streptomyces sp. NBC_00212]|uniref:hypothetical protein n=1 Tax=Streptomyces sp. NBC_00212 TaxID=2975684 RepID=UPI002F9118F0
MPESAQQSTAELVTQAWAEARGMAGADREHRHRAPGEITAAALRAHGALCTGLGRSVPVTALTARPGVRDLATFLAVYAAAGAKTAADRGGLPDVESGPAPGR